MEAVGRSSGDQRARVVSRDFTRRELLTSQLHDDGLWHAHYASARKTLCMRLVQPVSAGRRFPPTCGRCSKIARRFHRIDKSMPAHWLPEELPIEETPTILHLPSADSLATQTGPRPTGRPVIWTREAIIGALRSWHIRNGQPPRAADWTIGSELNPVSATASRAFGSWNAALEAAGLTIRRVGGQKRTAA